MRSMGFSTGLIIPAAQWTLGPLSSNRNEHQVYLKEGKGGLVRKAAYLAPFMCQLSRIPGSLNLLEP